jgi:hypothetical protein
VKQVANRADLSLGLFFDMKMEPVSSSEMLINFYITRSYTAEDSTLQHSKNWEDHADGTSSDKTANIINIKKQQKI